MIPLLCALLLAQTPPAKTQWMLETENKGPYQGDLFFRVTLKGLDIREWAIFLPKAPDLGPGIQTEVETTALIVGSNAKPVAVRDFSPLQRTIYTLRLPTQAQANKEMFEIRVKYKANLFMRKLAPLSEGAQPAKPVPPLKEAEKALYLSEWGDIKFKEKTFQEWLDNNECRMKPAETEIDFARRVFLHLHYKMDFDVSPTMDRRSTAVVSSMRSDGGGISNVYVAILRANKIPSRSLWGRWMLPGKEPLKRNNVAFNFMGVKTEFFAPGVGWVPADPGSALFEKKKVEPGLFFGMEQVPFLAQHVDPTVDVMNPVTKKRIQMTGLQLPGYWALAPAGPTSTPEFFQEWKATQPTKSSP
ncbi:MAG: transglutaminase domain-containing protein [Gemmataceae bacterium]|nr:transglutaminase domain-containing protein [Gemmataceae bacterium]